MQKQPTTIYKFTDKDLRTHNQFKWTVNKWHKIDYATAGISELCSNSWFHCYTHPFFARLMDDRHGCYTCLHAWKFWIGEARGDSLFSGDGKAGFTEMKLIKQIILPNYTSDNVNTVLNSIFNKLGWNGHNVANLHNSSGKLAYYESWVFKHNLLTPLVIEALGDSCGDLE